MQRSSSEAAPSLSIPHPPPAPPSHLPLPEAYVVVGPCDEQRLRVLPDLDLALSQQRLQGGAVQPRHLLRAPHQGVIGLGARGRDGEEGRQGGEAPGQLGVSAGAESQDANQAKL